MIGWTQWHGCAMLVDIDLDIAALRGVFPGKVSAKYLAANVLLARFMQAASVLVVHCDLITNILVNVLESCLHCKSSVLGT